MADLPRLASRLSKGSELLGAIMTSTMGSEQGSVKSDLDRVADQADAYRLADESVADTVGGPGETDAP